MTIRPEPIVQEEHLKKDATDQNQWSPLKTAFFNQIKFPKDTIEHSNKRTIYYLNKFDLYEQGKRKLGWNWSAFFGNSNWGGYRGLYSPLLIQILLSIMVDLTDIFEKNYFYIFLLLIPFIIGVSYSVYLGRQANLIYIRKVLDRIEKGATSYKPSIANMLGTMGTLAFVMKAFPRLLQYFLS